MKISFFTKTIQRPLIAGLLILCTVSACNEEKFFEQDAPPITAWKTVSDMEFGIGNAYRLTVMGNENAMWNFAPFVHFGMSDIVREISVNGGWNSNITYSRDTQQRIAQTDKYSVCYSVILYCNNLIDFIESDPFPNASESDKVKNIDRIKGEAQFLRALAYYHLLIWYAPAYEINGANDSKLLTLRLKTPVNLDIALDNTPTPTKEIYDQVVKDFTEAKALLPLKYEAGMHPAYQFGRATRHAAGAYLARTLMMMGKYDNALTELNAVLDDPALPRTLETNPVNNWTNNSATVPWKSSEVIWYGFFADANLGIRHNLQFHYFDNITFPNVDDWRDWWIWSLNTATLNRVGMLAEDKSVPKAWANDKRSVLYHRFEGYNVDLPSTTKYNKTWIVNRSVEGRVTKNDPVYLSNKFYLAPAFGQAKNEPPQNLPIIRSAELYLWRAALKQVTGKGGQAADLNKVRERAWDAAKSGPYVPLSDAEATWEQIDQEWIREMAFEGDRIIWLEMFRKPIGPGERNVPALEAPYPNLYWPIPLSETDFNKK